MENKLYFEELAWKSGRRLLAGIDEAGRGPLAGPVVAAACILPRGLYFEGLDDSKKLSEKKRMQLFEKMQNCQEKNFCFAFGIVDAKEIDRINIYQASLEAMKLALEGLKIQPDYLLVDAMPLKTKIETLSLIKGDSRSHAIAAASVLAKVTRDQLMQDYHQKWPDYGFAKHKGYGTLQHRQAINSLGPCPIHRLSFAPLKN